MSDSARFSEFISLLDADGPIALIIKQELAPDDEDERVIFPPTYPMTNFKGKVQRFEHGEYRVSIELPPDSKRDKDERKENQKPGYQIDRFPDGTNICEIDSIQSQSNRIEPKFKTIKEGTLVPQITIDVGPQTVNLLDAGHRAADAVIRMSSLASEFHDAWAAAKRSDLFPLATLAPTTLVFGAWDSRSSQMKLQRLFKAHIRVTNVRERTRSAQYTPAAEYVALGAISKATAELKDQDDIRLSKEGGVHALSTQTVGGVELTSASRLTRTINVNLAAIRQLRAAGHRPAVAENATDEQKAAARNKQDESDRTRTQVLREYVLGLTLVAAYSHPDLNLREGCNLQTKDDPASKLVQDRRKGGRMFDPSNIGSFAEHAAKAFFAEAKIEFPSKDKHGVFESGVAEEFLSLPAADRDEIRAAGPITRQKLDEFFAKKKKREQSGDPAEQLRKLVTELTIAKSGKNKGQFNKRGLDALTARVTEIQADKTASSELAEIVKKIDEVVKGNEQAEAKQQQLQSLFAAPAESAPLSAHETTAPSQSETTT
jgi:CRISPR-associated protein Csb1